MSPLTPPLDLLALGLAGLVLALASLALGGRLARALGIASAPTPVALSLGLGTLSWVLFGLGLFGLYRTAPILVLFAIALWWGRSAFRERADDGHWRWALLACIPAGALAIFPPTAFDGGVYHLPWARELWRTGSASFVEELRFPAFAYLQEALFALLGLLRDDRFPHVVSTLAFLAVTLYLLEAPIRRLEGLFAAALWAGTPIAVWLAGSNYIDVALSLFVVAAIDAWRRGLEGKVQPDRESTGQVASTTRGVADRPESWAAISGIFAGFAVATKYLGLFFVGWLALL